MRNWMRLFVAAGMLALTAVSVVVTSSPAGAAPLQRPRACSAPGAATLTVEAGDTWFDIAQEAGIGTRALLAVNEATDSTVIRPGDEICLPAVASAPTPASTSSSTPETECAGSAYTVVVDDSWYGIAKRSGVTVRSLLGANDAEDDTAIIPGDVLCLPPGAASSARTTPATGPNCERSGRTTYSVVADDSWYGIAVRGGVTLGSVLEANGATASSPLHIGDVLCLPKEAKPTAKAATTSTPPTTTRAAGMTALPAHGPCYFIDTWHAPRGNGRRHEGVDLLASAGRYVYAVADGVLSSRAWDQPGRRAGNAWWLTGNDGTYYFYAHLSAFAPGLKPGSRVKAGQVIGFVGATGNAAGPHLHFEIHPNGGSAINPYPAVSAMGGCKIGDAYPQPR